MQAAQLAPTPDVHSMTGCDVPRGSIAGLAADAGGETVTREQEPPDVRRIWSFAWDKMQLWSAAANKGR